MYRRTVWMWRFVRPGRTSFSNAPLPGSKISSPGSPPCRQRWWRSRPPAASRQWLPRARLALAFPGGWAIHRRVAPSRRLLAKGPKPDPIDAAVFPNFAEATKPQPRQIPDEMTRLLAEQFGLDAREAVVA